MIVGNRSALAAALALTGVFAVATATSAQEGASIQAQCQREAQDYGVAPEQFNDYVTGCVEAYGGVPEMAPEPEVAPPEVADDPDAGAPAGDEPDAGDNSDPDIGAAVE